MKLPNGERAFVDLAKLTEYCLSPDHPRGKHKARVFLAACGISAENAEIMREQLLDAAVNEEAVQTSADGYGQRFVVECLLTGPTGQARIRTSWIVRPGEDFPRFMSAYVM